MTALPEIFTNWFASRGWAPRAHQLALLEKARSGKSALLIAPTGGGSLDWQGVAEGWGSSYAPIGGTKPKESAANFADYLVKLSSASAKGQAAGFDSLGSALLGKRGKAGR